MNVEYKNLRIKIFFLGKLYNKYHKKFKFKNDNIIDCFKSKYLETIVPSKLNNSELNDLDWTLPKQKMIKQQKYQKPVICILIGIIKLQRDLVITKKNKIKINSLDLEIEEQEEL